MKVRKSHVYLAALAAVSITASCLPCHAAAPRRPAARSATAPAGSIYPQALCNGKVVRWINEQMPVKVWVSHGSSLDSFIDPASGAPETNTANRDHWPDLVIRVMQNPDQLNNLPLAPGYSDQQYQAAVQGINSWKSLEKDGLLSYELTDNPDDADIFVFWTNHFVNKMGLALFENDIRGYTAKYVIPVNQVVAAMQRGDLEMVKRSLKPVVVLLRTTEQDGSPINFGKMKASAAHEMGHALGVDQHSANAADLMSVYYGRGVQSANDLATMRYLYRSPAQLMP